MPPRAAGGRAQRGASAGTSGRGAQADSIGTAARGKAKATAAAAAPSRVKPDSDAEEYFDIPTAPLFDEAMRKAKHSRRELAALGGGIDAALGLDSFSPRERRAAAAQPPSSAPHIASPP